VLIVGADSDGIHIKRSLFNSAHIKIVGFIDENTKLHGRRIDGVFVYGFGSKLDKLLVDKKIQMVILSNADLPKERNQYILDFFRSRFIKTYTYPSPETVFHQKPSIARLSKIKMEDLLTRPEIEIDQIQNENYYKDKTILITGGAGSIGSEIVKQFLQFNFKRIIIIDIDETALFFLKERLHDTRKIEFLLINVLDQSMMSDIFAKFKVNFVFHAAAHKHVSVVEANPVQALKNNILGTEIVANLAISHKVEKFVLVSTDKAVNPTNLMGASKRFCELLINIMGSSIENKAIGEYTKFLTTRFGNVLGSKGSVLPIFRNQIDHGGPVTITHKEMTRYFMTIPEAAKLVIESCRIGLNDEIFLFDMGKPVKIIDLAENMISLSGYKPYVDIDIIEVGLRPGEKLFEELLLKSEMQIESTHKHLFIAKKESISEQNKELIQDFLNHISLGRIEDYTVIIKLLKKIIPEYKSNNSPYEILD
jgi:FlaA1/EpsC-like NDP-sugar epimerase